MRLPQLLTIALLVQCLNLALPAAADSDGWDVIYPSATRPGEPAVMTFRYTWHDAETPAPGIAAPEWGALPGGVRASLQRHTTETRPAETVSRVEIAFTADEPGAYAIPSIDVALRDAPREAFSSESFTLHVSVGHAEQWMAALAGGVLLCTGGFIWLRQRRRRAGLATASGQSRTDQIAGKLHEARRYRLDGNFYHYYQALTDAAALCDRAPDEDLVGKLRERTRQVGYQGLRPSDDELDSVMREVERASRGVNEEQTV